ncbi:MAG: prolyl oligopeptidase family serine peptidase [Bacteroidaceae bacterium]|nr:prolyl oligopeptidase family serine peptidase [Bacteroidaceae bacterium]
MKTTPRSLLLLLALTLLCACEHLQVPADDFFEDDTITPDSLVAEFPDQPFTIVTPADTLAFASMQKELEPLSSWSYDVEGIYCSPATGKPLFAAFTTRQYRVHHFYDKEFGNLFNRLQACLPQYQVRVLRSNEATHHWLVEATNDRTPSTYYSYDTDSDAVALIHAPSQARLVRRLAHVRPLTFTARDGQRIDAYLTLPHHLEPEKARNLPFVLLTRADSTRHYWQYDPFAQFYASRGCAVVQVNARGSEGYGQEFLSAASQRQDDIDDALSWLQSQGIINPQRKAVHPSEETDGKDVAARVAYCEEILRSIK